jgi:hypothetical protein
MTETSCQFSGVEQTTSEPPGRSPARRLLRIVLLLGLGVVLLYAFAGCGAMAYFVYLMGQTGPGPVPSDDELIANFETRRQEFSTLLGMMEGDRELMSIGFRSTDPSRLAAGVTAKRIARYRQLMRTAGIAEGMHRERGDLGGTIWFTVVYTGGVLSSDERGYVHSKKAPSPLADSLDGDAAVARYAFRHIVGGWYLFRWIDP